MARRFSFTILMVWLMAALLIGLAESSVDTIHLERILEPPSFNHLLGYDDLGRSLLSRVAAGARISFLVALLVVMFAALIGITVGIVAAWFGGLVDRLIVAIIDLFLAFPGILLAIALAGVLGPGIDNLVIALVTVGWVGFARLSRAQVMSLKTRDHVQAGRALGLVQSQLITRHVAPLMIGPLIVETSFAVSGVIVAEAGLSFLGLGVQPPTPSWGSMIRDGARYMLIAPHAVIVPGLALMSVVVSINLLGDALGDRLAVGRVRRATKAYTPSHD